VATAPAIIGWDAQGTPIQGSSAPGAFAPTPAIAGWDAQGNPIHASQATPPAPAANLTPGVQAIKKPAETPFDNSKGEGLYNMTAPDGRAVQIPYSKIQTVAPLGYRFADHDSLAQYARDHAADPVNEGMVDRFLEQLPWYDPVKLQVELFSGLGHEALKTATAFDRPPGPGAGGRVEQELQIAAATPPKNPVETGAGVLENIGEFIGGGEIADLVGAGLKGAMKYKMVAQTLDMLEKSPALAKVLRVGLSAVKQGGVGGAQTYVKTGGDTRAALTAGGETAAGGALVEGVAAPLLKAGAAKLAPQAGKGTEEFAATARAAGKGPLENINAATEPNPRLALPRKTGPYIFEIKGLPPTEGTEGELLHSAAKTPQAAFKQPSFTTASAPTRTIPANEGSMGADIQTAGIPEARTDIAKGGGILRTQDPEIVRNHIANLNEEIKSPTFHRLPPEQQKTLISARDNAQSQLREYEQIQQTIQRQGQRIIPKIDVAAELGKYGDYAGVRTAMKENLNQVVPAGVKARFNQLTAEIEALQDGEESGAKASKELTAKQQELTALVDKSGLTPELNKAVNAGWTSYFALRKVTGAFDKALQGHLGQEGANAAERGVEGINGNRLRSGINSAIVRYGRPGVAEALGGEEYLKSLEAIADKTSTSKGMFAVQRTMGEIARYLPVYLGYKAGEAMSGGTFTGGALLGATAAVTGAAIAQRQAGRVLAAVRSNPAIAQNLLFAIDAGANPKNYGPLIATMIQRHEAEAAKNREQEEENR
jgi:hypothetical protein